MKFNLSCIILFVKDCNRLKDFYTSNFNFETVEETPSQWVLLKAGNCEIGLHKIGDAYIDISTSESETNTKLVFDTDADINLLHQQMKKKNIDVTDVKTWDNYNYWLFDGKDPEGNVFQLRQKKIKIFGK
jgi:catechol-2,3-dioxygenase